MMGTFVSGLIVAVVWAWRTIWKADADGLHIGKQHIRWEDITDFYRPVPTTNVRQNIFRVETRTGRTLWFAADWKNREALCAAIAARAKNVKTDTWGIKGGRPCDEWPRTLTYDTKENRNGIWSFIIAIPLLSIYLLATIVVKVPKMMVEMGLPYTIALTAMSLIVVIGMPLAVGYIGTFGVLREARKRLREQVIVSRDGIVFADGKRRVAATWAEVTDFYLMRRKTQITPYYVVETKNGTFEFLTTLQDSPAVSSHDCRVRPRQPRVAIARRYGKPCHLCRPARCPHLPLPHSYQPRYALAANAYTFLPFAYTTS